MLTYETDGPVARIALGAPPVNALTPDLIEALIAALRRARADTAVRAVILHSAVPRYFSAGLDIAVLRDLDATLRRRMLEALYLGLLDAQFALGKPSIAAVAGAARGGGMTLAVSCNLIVAGEAASFGYPEIDLAVPPAIHLAHLPRITGRHRAYELLFTGRPFGPVEARELGLVARIAEGDVLAEATALARALAEKPPGALADAHAAFMAENDHRASVRRAVDLFCEAVEKDEARRAIDAFARKRR